MITFETKTENKSVKYDGKNTWEGRVTYPVVNVEQSQDENLHLIVKGVAVRVAEKVKAALLAADSANALVHENMERLRDMGVLEIVMAQKPEAFQTVPLPTELTITLDAIREKPAPRGKVKAESK